MRFVVVAVVACVTLPGCYIGTRVGPAFQRVNGAAFAEHGIEWDVTAGVELYLDEVGILNPLEGKNRLAVGATGISSVREDDAPKGTARAIGGGPPQEMRAGAGLMTVEVGRTLAQTVWSGSDRDPRAGALVRAAMSLGGGEGALHVTRADGSTRGGAANVLVATGGVEAGIHGGGDTIDSGGIFIGTGLRYSRYSAPDLAADSVSPYVSLTIEGGILLQILGEGFKGLGRVGFCR